jgi:hypothetical protein
MEMPGSTDIGLGTGMLLRLWRGLNDPDYKAEVEGNWKSFLAACDYHQVAPIVFHRFQGRADVPPQVLETSVLLHSTAAAYASTWPRGSAQDFVDGAINGGSACVVLRS